SSATRKPSQPASAISRHRARSKPGWTKRLARTCFSSGSRAMKATALSWMSTCSSVSTSILACKLMSSTLAPESEWNGTRRPRPRQAPAGTLALVAVERPDVQHQAVPDQLVARLGGDSALDALDVFTAELGDLAADHA